MTIKVNWSVIDTEHKRLSQQNTNCAASVINVLKRAFSFIFQPCHLTYFYAIVLFYWGSAFGLWELRLYGSIGVSWIVWLKKMANHQCKCCDSLVQPWEFQSKSAYHGASCVTPIQLTTEILGLPCHIHLLHEIFRISAAIKDSRSETWRRHSSVIYYFVVISLLQIINNSYMYID